MLEGEGQVNDQKMGIICGLGVYVYMGRVVGF